ncbi:MAG: GNAT family N-acetyltransferase [Thermoplasmata archaeon]
MRRHDPEWESLYFAATREDAPEEVVGWLDLGLTREGALAHQTNAHMAWVELAVLAPHRRQGIGRTLLAKAAEVARERDRSLLMGGTDEEDGKRFIEAVDAEVALRWRESRLVLDQVDWGMVEEWATEGPRRSPEATLRFVGSYVDAALIEEYCDVVTEVGNQEPREDLDLGDEFLTPEILRERVDNFVEAGGTLLRYLTQPEEGKISGYTVMGYFPEERTMIHQYGTGVREIWRGHGLGRWLKAAMLLRVRREFPQVKVVVTGNATSNAAMLSINQRLGFKPHKEGVEAQIRREDAEGYLAANAPEGI